MFALNCLTLLLGVGQDEFGFVASTKDATAGPGNTIMRLLHEFLLQFAPVDARGGRTAGIFGLASSCSVSGQ